MIRLLIIFILVVVILSLLGVNLAALVNDKTLRENFGFVWSWTNYIWSNYLRAPALKISNWIYETGIKQVINAFRSIGNNSDPEGAEAPAKSQP